MIGSWRIHGHAIVSADDKIAGPDGFTPASLRNEADWLRFQRALDRAAVTVLGRLGHEANANVRGRNRLILSSSVHRVERRTDGWWWNPAAAPLEEALYHAAPAGGIAAVPGGRRVFDLFLGLGFDEFHLACAASVRVPGGVPVFSEVAEGRPAAAVLAAHGLVADATELIDLTAKVTFTLWRHRETAAASA